MGKIIFQLLSCLYLYDSGIQVPVRIKKQSRYTGFRRQALTYRSAGIPASDATWKLAQSRYTDVLRVKSITNLFQFKDVLHKELLKIFICKIYAQLLETETEYHKLLIIMLASWLWQWL